MGQSNTKYDGNPQSYTKYDGNPHPTGYEFLFKTTVDGVNHYEDRYYWFRVLNPRDYQIPKVLLQSAWLITSDTLGEVKRSPFNQQDRVGHGAVHTTATFFEFNGLIDHLQYRDDVFRGETGAYIRAKFTQYINRRNIMRDVLADTPPKPDGYLFRASHLHDWIISDANNPQAVPFQFIRPDSN